MFYDFGCNFLRHDVCVTINGFCKVEVFSKQISAGKMVGLVVNIDCLIRRWPNLQLTIIESYENDLFSSSELPVKTL